MGIAEWFIVIVLVLFVGWKIFVHIIKKSMWR